MKIGLDMGSTLDEAFLNELVKHLALLKRQGLLETWHDRKIAPGVEFGDSIDRNIEEADIIILLVSPDFVSSDYCYSKELKRAMECHKKNIARVIPIIVRSVDLEGAPFMKLQSLPEDAKPVAKWNDKDDAWSSVAKSIRSVIKQINQLDEPIHINVENEPDREQAICIKADSDFFIKKKQINIMPIPKEQLSRIEKNINQSYGPFSVLTESINIQIEEYLLPLLKKRIRIESELRATHRMPFTKARITAIKQQLYALVEENWTYIVNQGYHDAIRHVVLKVGSVT